MAVLMGAPEAFNADALALFYAKDERLDNSPVLIFYGPSTTTNVNANSNRIQAHVFAVTGHKSYFRLTVDPTSRNYATVTELPADRQGDEACRGLAFSLFKYFQDIQPLVQDVFKPQKSSGSVSGLFDEIHAAALAAKMVRIENSGEVALQVRRALQEETLSWIELDVVVPGNSPPPSSRISEHVGEEADGADNEHAFRLALGPFADIVESFGAPAFLPTSRLRRAPSRPTNMARPKALNQDSVVRILQEMDELWNTESSYLEKLQSLSNCLENATYGDDSPGAQNQVKMVRPAHSEVSQGLAAIIAVSRAFCARVQVLLGDTTDAAPKDTIFILSLAQLLQDFIPRFSDPYKSYIKLSSQFSHWISEANTDGSSLIARAAAQVGEQRLKSWMIEPVQRLPRYSLFVDNITKQLPTAHPALRKLLKARDMINDICALDDEEAGNTLAVTRLQKLCEDWPDTIQPCGRLITAADAVEVHSVSQISSASPHQSTHMLVLFSDSVLVFEKSGDGTPSSRGLLAELDRPKSSPSSLFAEGPSELQRPLRLVSFSILEHTQFLETGVNHIFSMTGDRMKVVAPGGKVSAMNSYTSRKFRLGGPYEGKASKWTEEVARARVEQRFPESFRDSPSWTLRSLQPGPDGPGIIAAVYIKPAAGNTPGFGSPFCRVHMSLEDDSSATMARHRSQDASMSGAVIDVSKQSDASYRVSYHYPGRASSVVEVHPDDFTDELRGSIGRGLLRRSGRMDTASAQSSVSRLRCALMSLEIRLPLQHSTSRSRIRPLSPVKVLSSLLGSATKDRKNPEKDSITAGYAEPPPVRISHEPRVVNPGPGYRAEVAGRATVATASGNASSCTFQQLEDTLSTYTVAISCRAGNIVGKALRNRAGADQVKVNELYNALNEDPTQHRAAAEVPVDILFAAFEKFIRVEWAGKIGPILSATSLGAMQSLFDTTATNQVRDQFAALLAEMSPQNKRALGGVVKLLYELLDASGNDGDRGILTVTFAEILTPTDGYWECIPILDRLVEDMDRLFDDTTSTDDRASRSPSRMRSVNSASVGSAGSSLRRKFGLGKLSRENSRLETETRVGQVWRTLSKKSHNSEFGSVGSRSKFTLGRSKSTDRERHGSVASSRPCSAGSMATDVASNPATASVVSLDKTAHSAKHVTSGSKSRRRSSLSDLRDVNHLGPGMGSGQNHSTGHLEAHKPRTEVKKNTAPGRVGYQSVRQSPGAFHAPLEALREYSGNQMPPPHAGGAKQKSRAPGSGKIREHLDAEAAAAASASGQLQAELAELRAHVQAAESRGAPLSAQQVLQRVARVEARAHEAGEQQARRIEEVRGEVGRSLAVSEGQRRKADKLFQETNEENEMLYERYNSELQQLFAAGPGERATELARKLDEANREAAKFRSEMRRLRRKNATLKAEVASWQ